MRHREGHQIVNFWGAEKENDKRTKAYVDLPILMGRNTGKPYGECEHLTLPPLEAAGFLLHRERPAVAGLTLAPQAFIVSVCPTATSILTPSSLTFLAAL